MAVTFAISNVRKNVFGNYRANTGTITLTGTPTSGGDAITPAQLGLHTIISLIVTPVVDSTATPANAAYPEYNATSPGLGGSIAGKLVFFGGAASGVVGAAITGSLTGYSGQFIAFGT